MDIVWELETNFAMKGLFAPITNKRILNNKHVAFIEENDCGKPTEEVTKRRNKMNLCEALEQGKQQQKAIRRQDWPRNLAWYHGMDNSITWWNDAPDSPCVHKTGDMVSFAVADFWYDNYEVHDQIPYHGDLFSDKTTEDN